MKNTKTNIRILGAILLLQAVTSLTSAVAFLDPLLVEGDITATLANYANNPTQVYAGIFIDMITAIGIVALGALFYKTLKHEGPRIGLVAFGLYILEAGLIPLSKLGTFTLLQISQLSGNSDNLHDLAELALYASKFTATLHMLLFCVGAMLFYYLLNKSQLVPRAISLWGLISMLPVTYATLMAMFGITVPFFIYVPYVPFEFFTGIWLMIAGPHKRYLSRLETQ